jgi:sucrose-phosphate synthase
MHVVFLNPQGNFDERDSYLTEHPDFGGQLVYVKEVAKALSRLGVRVDIATRRIEDPDWPEFSSEIDHYRGYEASLRILRLSCGGRRFLNKEHLWPHLEEFTDALLAHYAGKMPDFATAHYGDGGYCGVLLKSKVGLQFTFTGHSLGAQKLDKLGTNAANFEEMERQFHFSQRIAAERLSMSDASRVITSTLQERFEQYAHPLYRNAIDVGDDARFSVIPPGVNTAIFNSEPCADDDEVHHGTRKRTGGDTKPCIIVSSRLDDKKNIIGVVNAYTRSVELQRRARLGIFIRGVDDPFAEIDRLPSCEQHILRPILEAIDHAHLRDHVFFLNVQSQAELAATYRYFAEFGSVFALTAFYEPFGLAPIEAAACGLAVVATRNGGPSEIFADGAGVLVDPFNEQDIAEGLLEGIVAAARYAAMGRQRVEERYVWEKTAKAYLTLITEGATRPSSVTPIIGALDATERLRRYLSRKQSKG